MKRGIYILPNLFTTGSLFAGFYSMVATMNGDFRNAAIWVLVSSIFDGLDGKVAILILIYFLAFLMVSNIRYYSFKDPGVIKKQPFAFLVLAILLLIIIAAM